MADPLHTVSGRQIPFKRFVPPTGRWELDYYVSYEADVIEKAQQILAKGFTFTAEPLRLVGKVSFTIEGLQQFEEGEELEEQDVAIEVCDNGPSVVEAINKLIRNFVIPEDGVVRSWKETA